MSDFLDGKNALIFSYGVTNAGKTFTIQGRDRNTISLKSKPCKVLLVMFWNGTGTPKEPGILPRVLEITFQYIAGRQYQGMDLKPYLRNDVQSLDFDQVKQERSIKAAVFASVKEVRTRFEPVYFWKEEVTGMKRVLHANVLSLVQECDPLRVSSCLASSSATCVSSSNQTGMLH